MNDKDAELRQALDKLEERLSKALDSVDEVRSLLKLDEDNEPRFESGQMEFSAAKTPDGALSILGPVADKIKERRAENEIEGTSENGERLSRE